MKYKIHKPHLYDSNYEISNSINWEGKVYTKLADGSYAEELKSDTEIIYNIEKNETKKNNIIPSFSSFWHNESDILPDIVVASINSFLKYGYDYYLYVYKEYKNIPNGVIIRNANTIINESELFLDMRGSYALFSDYFRVKLIEKYDTAWTDTDNFLFNDNFDTETFLIIQDNRIQNGCFYLGHDEKSKIFKQMLVEFYNNPQKILSTDSNELINAKKEISKYNNKFDALKNAKWGIGGSCLYTSIHNHINMSEYTYQYNKYFNGFHYTNQYKLFVLPEKQYMNYYNKDVKILVMSFNLLMREPWIMHNYNKKSYISNTLNKYKS